MANLTAAEAIVQTARANGVDMLLGLPGVQSDYRFNALYDQDDKIRVIHTCHEQGSAVDIPVGEMPSPWGFTFAPSVRPRSR